MGNKFNTAKRRSSVDPEAVAKFGAGANSDAPVVAIAAAVPAFDPNAPPRRGMAIRLNDYQLEMIRALAKDEDRSAQKLLKAIVLPELQRRYQELIDRQQ